MKHIASLRQDDRGFYVDLDDRTSAIAVNRRTRDVLLDEGDGDDRYHGAVLFGADNPRFIAKPSTTGVDVYLDFGTDRDRHFVGQSCAEQALEWVCRVNESLGGVGIPFEISTLDERMLHMWMDRVPLTDIAMESMLPISNVFERLGRILNELSNSYRSCEKMKEPLASA